MRRRDFITLVGAAAWPLANSPRSDRMFALPPKPDMARVYEYRPLDRE